MALAIAVTAKNGFSNHFFQSLRLTLSLRVQSAWNLSCLCEWTLKPNLLQSRKNKNRQFIFRFNVTLTFSFEDVIYKPEVTGSVAEPFRILNKQLLDDIETSEEDQVSKSSDIHRKQIFVGPAPVEN